MAKLYKRTESRLYWCRFQVDGKEVRKPTGQVDKAKAQQVADQLEAEARKECVHLTIADAIERYWLYRETSLSPYTVRDYGRYFQTFQEWLGQEHKEIRYLKDISTEHFAAYLLSRRKEGRGEIVARCLLVAWNSLFSTSRLWPDGVKDSPIKQLDTSRLKKSNSIEVHITGGQLRRLEDSCTRQWQKDMIIFAAFTGLRIREQSELQWRQVNLTKKELTLYVDGTKTKTARTVPLCAIAVRILQRMSAQPHSPLDLVFKNRFGGKVNTNGGWWFRCKKAAGLPHIRWHDLRHHFASWWMQNGGNEFHLQRVLGHTTTSMTKRYAHLRTEDLHHDLAKVDRTGRTAYEGVSDGVDTAQDPC